VSGALITALSETVDALHDGAGPEPAERAVVALARELAAELDGAHAVSARARDVAEAILEANGHDRTASLYEEVDALRAKLSERNALDRLGARLLEALAALGATPAAAAKLGTRRATPAVGGKLGELRGLQGGRVSV
jgi:hypothetical protein